MDMMLVKSEMLNENRRRVLGVTAAASSEVKHIKRRRREPALLAVVTAGSKKDGTMEQTTGTTIKRSSKFRGVSRHRWTGRYEAHLWDKGSWNATQRKKGKQVYLGAYDVEESAARAYDLAALKYWGPTTFTNFPVADYEKEIEIMQTVTKEEYLASLRRKSSGFSRGVSKYRGVARHHHNGRWEARIGRVFGNKYLYLGTYSTQEEAAHAYDIAAIEYRGINAVTNFDLSTYIRWLRPGSTTNNININLQEQNKNGGLQFQTTLQPSSHFLTNLDTQVPPPTQRTFQLEELQVPCKQEFVSLQSQASKSSPTALSILLRSSVFQQLVEKNSNAEEEEENDNGLMYEGIEIEESDNAYYEKNDGGIWNGVMGIQ